MSGARGASPRSGPRTAAGKARSARNAFRHGLCVSVLSDPVTAGEVEALTRRITQAIAHADDHLAALARRVAEAQVDLIRIRRVRHEALAEVLRRFVPSGPAEGSDLLSKLAPRLAVMNRYERDALSRRKFAIRDFDAMSRARDRLAGRSAELRNYGTNPKFINEISERLSGTD